MPPRLLTTALLLALSLPGQATPERVDHFARQVMRSGDAGGRPFAVLDKPSATLRVFSAQGRLRAESRVLIGQARGDTSAPDIGTRPLSRIRLHEKVTAAGRYVTEPGVNLQGEDIVWLDYDAALSMHRVRQVPGEHRPQRLQTPGTQDKRISFGCINMPPDFYDQHIDPLFARQTGVVYVLPEDLPLRRVFSFLD